MQVKTLDELTEAVKSARKPMAVIRHRKANVAMLWPADHPELDHARCVGVFGPASKVRHLHKAAAFLKAPTDAPPPPPPAPKTAKTELERMRRRMMESLEALGEATITQWADEAGMGYLDVARRIRYLLQRGLVARLETGRYRFVPRDRRGTLEIISDPTGRRRAKIRDHLKKKRWVTSPELAAMLETRASIIGHDLLVMKEEGLAVRHGKGPATYWAVPDFDPPESLQHRVWRLPPPITSDAIVAAGLMEKREPAALMLTNMRVAGFVTRRAGDSVPPLFDPGREPEFSNLSGFDF